MGMREERKCILLGGDVDDGHGQGGSTARGSGYRGASARSPISARRRRKFFLRSESCGNFD